MRQVVIDTETTGLDPGEGHRIIELGCVELIDRRATERRFHHYLHPERDIDAGALEVHGITLERLKDSPKFADIAESFLAFIEGAELLMHNAPFDVSFLNYELGLLKRGCSRIEDRCTVLDTLALARELHPGQKNTLDALCRRYQVDNTGRSLHGALLDAEILAEVYLAMTGGQVDLLLGQGTFAMQSTRTPTPRHDPRPLRVVQPTAHELSEHNRLLELLDQASGRQCLWRAWNEGS